MTDTNPIGRELRRARLALGLSQKDLCERMGWSRDSQGTLSQYETGAQRPSVETWFALANAMGLSAWIGPDDDWCFLPHSVAAKMRKLLPPG